MKRVFQQQQGLSPAISECDDSALPASIATIFVFEGTLCDSVVHKKVSKTTLANRLKNLPRKDAAFVEPMECSRVSQLPTGDQWLYEIKLDGHRAIAVKAGKHIALFSRRCNSLNAKFPYLAKALDHLPEGTVIDSEFDRTR
jgi:ATP-dependent DNA ligase